MTNYREPTSTMESKSKRVFSCFFLAHVKNQWFYNFLVRWSSSSHDSWGQDIVDLCLRHFVLKCASSSASSAMKWEALALLCRHQTHVAYHAGRKCMRPTLLAVTARGAEKHVAASPCPPKSLLAGSCGSWSSGASSCSKHAAWISG